MDNRPDQKDKISQKDGEKTEIRETIPVKNPKDFEQLKAQLQEKIRKKKERQPKIEPKELKINISKPEKDAKTPANENKKPGKMAKITPEQMNMLVNGISNTVTFIRQTEGIAIDESEPFSKALYEVADANGWLDDLNFLPYLVLAASGTQLAVVIMTKPKKQKSTQQVIKSDIDLKSQVQSAPEIPKGEAFDVVDQDALVNKINSVR